MYASEYEHQTHRAVTGGGQRERDKETKGRGTTTCRMKESSIYIPDKQQIFDQQQISNKYISEKLYVSDKLYVTIELYVSNKKHVSN